MDGERNLKSKLALRDVQNNFETLMKNLAFQIEIPLPTKELYDFNGQINTDKEFNISGVQFIPRGSVLRNSGSIHAVVVYTGVETKLE